MAHKIKTVKRGQLWLKCPSCETDREKFTGHFSIRLRDGVYHCLKCHYSGRCTPSQLLTIIYQLPDEIEARDISQSLEWEDLIEFLYPGPAISRMTKLPRFHTEDGADVFKLLDFYGEVIGLYVRKDKKTIIGEKGISYCHDTLLSSEDNPLRIVEGPYDVMTDQDVAVYGTFNSNLLRKFKGHYLILCPDGDIWTKEYLYKGFFSTLSRVVQFPSSYPTIVGIEYLPDGLDPDEVPVTSRKILKIEDLIINRR